MGRDTLGEFEHQVLLSILRLGGEGYSVGIVLELEERTRRDVSQSAVFMTLRRMEKKGLLSSRLDDASVPATGRERRYFALTSTALEKLRDTRTELLRLWEGVADRLDEA